MTANSVFKHIVPLLLLAALLMSGCSAQKNKTADIRKVADKIAGYSLPEGYSEQFALDVLGYQLVSLTGPTESCHIYLVQAPKDIEVDIAKLQEQARSMEGGEKSGRPRDVHVVETRSASLRGQEVPVLVGEGINSQEQPYREVTALFQGRGGPALVSISSPASQWDWEQVDLFLASVE